MAYEVIARKWRPQQFADVIGQEHVARTLVNAIQTDHIAHAYLFVGPRGIGKTSLARIFAKALNCVGGPRPEPCDKCPSCLEIMEGSSLDVIEMDAASNTGVDYIRELRENVLFAPARGPYKIYIIDEVHMLTVGAFNALLKTLEEPPKHVKFVLATTDPQKVLPTIISRCQRFDLRPISSRQIMDHIRKIAEAEGVAITDDALLAIARGAEGGMRDAESTLDQLMAFCGREIGEQDVMSVFGLVAREKLEALVDALLQGDVPQAIGLLNELDRAGKDLSRLALELLQYLRNLLIFSYVDGDVPYLDIAETQRAKFREQAPQADPARILRMIERVAEAGDKLRYALSKRTILEVALIHCARTARAVSIDALMESLAELKKKVESGGGGCLIVEESGVSAAEGRDYAGTGAKSAESQKKTPDLGGELARLRERWHEISEAAGRHSTRHVRDCLIDSEPVEVLEHAVRVAFDPEFAGELDQMEVFSNKRALVQVLAEELGRPVSVHFEVLPQKEVLPADHPQAGNLDGNKPDSSSGSAGAARVFSRQEWMENSAVRLTLEAFGGEIVDIRA